MFWKSRKSSITVPRELHDRVTRSCVPILDVPSEVIAFRRLSEGTPQTLPEPFHRPGLLHEADLVPNCLASLEPVRSWS